MDVDDESLRNLLSSVESSVVLEDFRPNEELKRGVSCLGVEPLKSKSEIYDNGSLWYKGTYNK